MRTKHTEDFTEAVIKDENGNLIELAELHLEWHAFIREQKQKGKKRIGILAPWKFGKTPNMLAILLQELSEEPNLRCKFICNDDNSATKRLEMLKNYIEFDEDYKIIYGDKIKPDHSTWSKHAFLVQRTSRSVDPSVEAASILSSGMGGTFDRIFFDDVCDLNNSVLSRAKRETVKAIGKNVWLSRLDINGIAYYIGTAWHLEDWTHELIQNTEFSWLIQRVSEDFTRIEQIVINGD